MERKDFYFSATLHRNHYDSVMRNGEQKRITKFKGATYTECCDVGTEPSTNHFGDLKYLGTGTYEDVEFAGNY